MRPSLPDALTRTTTAVLFVCVSATALAATTTPESFPGGVASETAATWKDLANPTSLSPEEEAAATTHALARRYNPAMAFAHDDIWPVPVQYAWHDGARLIGQVVTREAAVVSQFIALEHAQLATHDWSDLPDTDEHGNRIDYRVDVPGDDRVQDGVSRWRQRWRVIMKDDPQRAPYRPTQYAHLFWFNRDKGLLAIQYWFYYPYNEWINHHEGDWEHINVILRGPSRLAAADDYRPVGYQFFFHEFAHEPRHVVRVAGHGPREDHVVVYVGGRSQFYNWRGLQSGGSYPLPAEYDAAGGGFGKWRPADDVKKPSRFIRADDFDVVLLPEPDRLDVGLHPELSWLRLSFFAGQAQVFHNPLTLNGVSFGSTPRQPARQETWNADWTPPYWDGQPRYDRRALALPADFTPLLEPPRGPERPQLSARRKPGRHGRVRHHRATTLAP